MSASTSVTLTQQASLSTAASVYSMQQQAAIEQQQQVTDFAKNCRLSTQGFFEKRSSCVFGIHTCFVYMLFATVCECGNMTMCLTKYKCSPTYVKVC